MPHDRIACVRFVSSPGTKHAWWVACRVNGRFASVAVTTSEMADYHPFRRAMLRRRGVVFSNPDYCGRGGPDAWDERLRRVMMVNQDFNQAATVAV